MNTKPRELTKQLMVRVEPELYEAIQRDADEHGRTVAQSIRFYLKRAVTATADD